MNKERGSDVLRRMHGGAGADANLESLYRTVDDLDLKVLRWLPKGTPVWDRVEAVFQVPTSRVGQAVEKLINLEQLAPNLRVFPYGIPVPDIAVIELEAQAR